VRAQHEVQIRRPVGEVFDFVADGANNPRWQPRVIHTAQTGGHLGLGTSFRQSVRHPLGFPVSANYRLTVFDRPRLLALVVTSGGPIRPTETYELAEAGRGATKLRCTIEYRPQGLARMVVPLLGLVHPLFAWEASWVDRARDILETDTR
jgi:uncharacterized protein YndB with AHSA1/START domain